MSTGGGNKWIIFVFEELELHEELSRCWSGLHSVWIYLNVGEHEISLSTNSGTRKSLSETSKEILWKRTFGDLHNSGSLSSMSEMSPQTALLAWASEKRCFSWMRWWHPRVVFMTGGAAWHGWMLSPDNQNWHNERNASEGCWEMCHLYYSKNLVLCTFLHFKPGCGAH